MQIVLEIIFFKKCIEKSNLKSQILFEQLNIGLQFSLEFTLDGFLKSFAHVL